MTFKSYIFWKVITSLKSNLINIYVDFPKVWLEFASNGVSMRTLAGTSHPK